MVKKGRAEGDLGQWVFHAAMAKGGSTTHTVGATVRGCLRSGSRVLSSRHTVSKVESTTRAIS
ncbi:MAG: hypothetical protein RLZZ239_344, partial [Pseudomonadota bacterium]